MRSGLRTVYMGAIYVLLSVVDVVVFGDGGEAVMMIAADVDWWQRRW